MIINFLVDTDAQINLKNMAEIQIENKKPIYGSPPGRQSGSPIELLLNKTEMTHSDNWLQLI